MNCQKITKSTETDPGMTRDELPNKTKAAIMTVLKYYRKI